MSGITNAGFTVKVLQEILGEIQQAEKDRIKATLNVATTTPLGQLNGIFSEREALLWELLRVAFDAYDPDAAEGWLLDAVCALTGCTRLAARPSLVAATVNLDAGVTLPAGSTAHVVGQPTRLFQTRAAVTATAAGDYSVVFQSSDNGPVPANSGTLTQIAGPVTGWNSVTNATDAVLGADVETDEAFRLRREQELQLIGGSTPDAIRSDLINISGVQQCKVFENLSETTDENGIPAFSIEVLVYDGIVPSVSNDVIAQAIWDTRPADVRLFGNASGNAVDAEGNTQAVKFSRPSIKPIWITANVKQSGAAPANATDLLRDHLVTEANKQLQPDTDVVALLLKCILLDSKADLGFTWVYDVPSLFLGFGTSPTNQANLSISPREIPQLDTSRTTITLV